MAIWLKSSSGAAQMTVSPLMVRQQTGMRTCSTPSFENRGVIFQVLEPTQSVPPWCLDHSLPNGKGYVCGRLLNGCIDRDDTVA